MAKTKPQTDGERLDHHAARIKRALDNLSRVEDAALKDGFHVRFTQMDANSQTYIDSSSRRAFGHTCFSLTPATYHSGVNKPAENGDFDDD